MTVRDWTDAMVQNLEQFGNLGRLDHREDWREWGAELLNLPAISGSIIPDPYQFDDWRAWAQRCNENLSVVP
jgi:hypothetical protein